MRAKVWTQVILVGILMMPVAACAPVTPQARETGPAGEQSSRGFRRAVGTTLSEQRAIVLRENFAVAGKPEVETLVHQGLVTRDQNLVIVPRLAEAVPSVENGLWKVLPDGRMETTWRIRDGARWQDGTPFTADDLLFTARVIRDPAMADLYASDFELIENVEAVDTHTVRVTWKRPFIDADQLFGVMGPPAAEMGAPLPKHLLEQAYLEEKSTFSALPYWSAGFVGMGPYKIKEWVLGSGRMVLSANDSYVLGRPRIDEIEIRMITDNNTMLANILANEIDFTLGRNLSFEQSQTVRQQWRDGTVRVGAASNPLITYPGFLYADPAIVRDVRFRRAWLQAINRQELAEALLPGFSSVAHSFLLPSDPDYPALEGSMVKYAYDPQSSIRTLGELGYTRGADGMFRDAAGQTLTVELRTTSDNEIHVTALYPTIDYLKAVGVQVTPEVIPPARQRDLEYRAKIPGFQQTQGSGSLSSFSNFQSSQQKTAENGWRGQHTGYSNPEFDAMVDRYFTTIPKAERLRVAGQALQHMTDQLVIMTSFYVSATQIVANRLKNVPTNGSAANIQEWESDQ